MAASVGLRREPGKGRSRGTWRPVRRRPHGLDESAVCNYIFVGIAEITDPVHWTWDPIKDRANRRRHGLSFETAALVFDDPLAASRPDSDTRESRWNTVGMIGGVIVFVVHTWPDRDAASGEEVGRIISARKATPHERKAYEEGNF